MYDGWTESPEQTQARRERILKALSDKEGTAPSPVISGGEILEQQETQSIIDWLEDDPDSIPF